MTTIEIKQIHPCRRELKIQVPSETMEKEYESVCEKLGRRRRIPGFRPGKAPLKILKKYVKRRSPFRYHKRSGLGRVFRGG